MKKKTICSSMNEKGRCHPEGSHSEDKGYMQNDVFHMWNLKDNKIATKGQRQH